MEHALPALTDKHRGVEHRMGLSIERIRAFAISVAPIVAWLKRMTQGEQLRGDTPCGALQQ
jgi:hypothetical protein